MTGGGHPTKEVLAKIRGLHDDAPAFVKSLELRPAAAGQFLPLNTLVAAFIRSHDEDPSSKLGERLSAPAGRAISTALVTQFGADVPRVHLAKGSCEATQQQSSAGFAVESDEYPSRPVILEAGAAKAAREVRKARRQENGDLQYRPLAEQGAGVDTVGVPVEGQNGGGSSRYLSELLRCSCAPELLRLKLYPDAKELTESFAAYHAVRTHLSAEFSPEDPTVTVVCVGDGSVPRTAALFAFRTKWQCYAVDPQMRNPGSAWGGVERLHAVTAKIQDCTYTAEKILVVCVHAHVGLDASLEVMQWKKTLGVVAMPCCNFYSKMVLPGKYAQAPIAEYYDAGVVSPHRFVRVFRVDGDGQAGPAAE